MQGLLSGRTEKHLCHHPQVVGLNPDDATTVLGGGIGLCAWEGEESG